MLDVADVDVSVIDNQPERHVQVVDGRAGCQISRRTEGCFAALYVLDILISHISEDRTRVGSSRARKMAGCWVTDTDDISTQSRTKDGTRAGDRNVVFIVR